MCLHTQFTTGRRIYKNVRERERERERQRETEREREHHVYDRAEE